MKTMYIKSKTADLLLKAGRKIIHTLLTTVMLSASLFAQQHHDGSKESEACTICEEERHIQQITEEMKLHLPQLDVSAKLSSLQSAVDLHKKSDEQFSTTKTEKETTSQTTEKTPCAKEKCTGS